MQNLTIEDIANLIKTNLKIEIGIKDTTSFYDDYQTFKVKLLFDNEVISEYEDSIFK